MSTLTPTIGKPKSDGNRIAGQLFAQVFQAYLECSDEIQAVIRDLVKVHNASDATAEEREAALSTIIEALFPSSHNGALGVCLEDCEENAPAEIKAILREMDREEATFGERVNAALDSRQMTQGDLASAIGVKQPAISMLLSRECRPQRRTVEKIAAALKVSVEDLWPGFKED